MHEKRVAGAYLREMTGALLLYTVLLVAAIRWGRPMDEGLARTLVLLSPMIGVAWRFRIESSPAEAVTLKPQFSDRCQTCDVPV